MKSYSKLLGICSLLFIALAYIESAIVVYLRELYYPDGFHFPIRIIKNNIAIIEIGREAVTIIILYLSALISAKSFKDRFALFIFNFGIWDLFYYIWLKVLINWPHSWLEWDILFLIPLPWASPWIAPALVSIGFIISAYLIIAYPEKFKDKILNKTEWLLEITAAGLILWSFLWQTFNILQEGIPQYYPWWLFIIGMGLGLYIFINRFVKGN